MKKLFISMLAVAAMVSCSKEQTIVADKGELIGFGNAFVDNATRADYSSTDITAFKVYGTVNDVNIFNGDDVTKGTADYGVAWALTDAETKETLTQYWIEGASYKFAAVVDANKVNVDDTTGMPTSLEYSAAGQKDMLYKYKTATGKAKDHNEIVSFSFTHLLAKAYFTVTNGTPDSKYTYTISDVKVTNAYQNGVYNVNGDNGSWIGSNVDATTFDNIESVANGTPKTNAEMLLIPGAKVGVSFTVTLFIDGKKVTSYDVEKTEVATLAPNTIYNFNVALTPNDPIQFTVTEKPNWGEPTTNVHVDGNQVFDNE